MVLPLTTPHGSFHLLPNWHITVFDRFLEQRLLDPSGEVLSPDPAKTKASLVGLIHTELSAILPASDHIPLALLLLAEGLGFTEDAGSPTARCWATLLALGQGLPPPAGPMPGVQLSATRARDLKFVVDRHPRLQALWEAFANAAPEQQLPPAMLLQQHQGGSFNFQASAMLDLNAAAEEELDPATALHPECDALLTDSPPLPKDLRQVLECGCRGV